MSDKEVADEEKQDVDVAEGKTHPETVPWSQYVGIKEKFGKVETDLTGKVQSLEEQLKNAPNSEEFEKIKTELEETKGKLQTTSDELKGIKTKSVSDKKEYLKAKGVAESELEGMSDEALTAAVRVIEQYKPKPDLSGGGGGTPLVGKPMDLAVQAYTK